MRCTDIIYTKYCIYRQSVVAASLISLSGILYCSCLVQPFPRHPPIKLRTIATLSLISGLFRIKEVATENLHPIKRPCEFTVPRAQCDPSGLAHKDPYKDMSTISTPGPRARKHDAQTFQTRARFFASCHETGQPRTGPKTVPKALSERLGGFSILRENVQPPGSPETAATKPVFKS